MVPPIRTARNARIWNYLNWQDEFFACRLWPGWLQEIAVKPASDRSRHENYRFFAFMFGNGVRPDIRAMWFLMEDVYNGTVAVSSDSKLMKNLTELEAMTYEAWTSGRHGSYFDMIKYKVEKW